MATLLTQTYNLNLIPGQNIVVVNVSAYDNSPRLIRFNMYNGSAAIDVSAWAARVEGTRQFTDAGFSTTATVSGSTVTFAITNEMTASSGRHRAVVVFYQGEDRVASADFVINVSKAALDESTPATEEDNTLYQQWIAANTAQIQQNTVTNQQNTAQIQQNATAIDTLSARMDTFASLPSGSTSGDAELIDIRVGADGTVYPTAGDAVRGQVGDLEADTLQIRSDLYTESSNLLDFTFDRNLWKQGAPNALTQLYTVYYDKKFPVTEGEVIHGAVKIASISGFRLVAFAYDSSDAFIARTQVAFNAQAGSYTVPSGVAYVYFGFTTNSASIRITPSQIISLGNAAYAGSEAVTAVNYPAHFIPTTDEINYYDFMGIPVEIGAVHTISPSDVVDFYDSTVIPYRIGTPSVQQFDEDITFTPNTGFGIYFLVMLPGETAYTASDWKTTAYTIPANAKWVCNIRKVPEDTSAMADLETFAKAIKTSVPLGTVRTKVDYVSSEVDALSKQVFDSGDICQKYIDRNDILTQMTGKPLFLIYTDIHGFTAYLNRISEYYQNNCQSDVRDAICLGDIIYNTFSDSAAILNTDFGKKSLLTIGNHDCYDGTTVGGVSATDLYNKFFANVSQWNVVQPEGASENGYCYYYKDYDNKVRLIVLNEYYWDNAQKEWFESTLSEARTAGLAAIVAQHQGNFIETEYTPLNDYAFGTKGYSFIRYTSGYAERRNAVDEFMANGGEFVGWINGHTHCEQFGTFTINGRTQLNMTFSNAGQDPTSRFKKINYSQDCFYYLAVDTTKKMVYVLTVGQATNKYFKRNLMLAYNYQTQEVIEYH